VPGPLVSQQGKPAKLASRTSQLRHKADLAPITARPSRAVLPRLLD
jgi:hypothetical protein